MKKRLIAIILCAAMLAALFAACQKPTDDNDKDAANTGKPGEGETVSTEQPTPDPAATPDPNDDPVPVPTLLHPLIVIKNDSTIISTEYVSFVAEVAALNEEESAAYPALSSALMQRLAVNQEAFDNEFGDFVSNSVVDPSHNDDEDYFGYSLAVRAYIRRADSAAFSVLYSHDYTLGTYMEYFRASENFDTATGRRLSIADVVTDVSALPALINEQMIERNEDGFTLDENGDYSAYFNDPDCKDFAWTLDYNGITFFFNEHAFGIEDAYSSSLFISFAEHPELFKKEYTTAPENYAVAFPCGQNCYFDINGKTTSVFVNCIDYNEWTYTTVFVALDDEYYTDDNGEIFDIDAILVHANGSDYLYIRTSGMDDYSSIRVLDITSGKAKKCGIDSYSWYGVETGDWIGLDNYAREPITDPAAFRLNRRTDLLSTVEGFKLFHVGGNGMPVSDESFYTLKRIFTFTMLQDLEAVLIDENGADIGTVTLKTGDTVEYVGTDGETIGILRLSDGRLAKVTVEHVDWEYCIDGTPINEIFDGIMYAG